MSFVKMPSSKSSHKPILCLAFIPPGIGGSIFAKPVRVYYYINHLTGNSVPSVDSWDFHQGDGNYIETNELFNRIAEMKVGESVTYDNISMWQFLPSYLWPHFFLATQLVDVVRKIIEQTQPEQIRLFIGSDYVTRIFRGIVETVADARGIPVATITSGDCTNRISKLPRDVMRRLGLGVLIRQIHRIPRTLSLIYEQAEGEQSSPNRKKLLFLTLGKRHWVSVPGHSEKWHDEQMYPLLKAFRSDGWNDFIFIDCQDSDWRELRRRKTPDIRWRRFSSYSAINTVGVKLRPVFSRMFESLRNDPRFLKELSHRGVSLMPALNEVLKNAFTHILPQCARMLVVAKRMLQEEHPMAIVTTYETGPWARSVIIEASRAHIPTIGLQHGALTDSPDYMHRLIITDVALGMGFVVPNITCVWGPAWKDELTKKGHYPPGSVLVTGNWRYDQLSMLKKHATDSNKRVVLILSSGFNVLDYLRKCLQAISGKQLTPIIKLHPGVDDPKPVREMLTDIGFSENILNSGPLIQAMLQSDLVISQISTAVSEAALLNRPIILANFERLPGAEVYVNSGICLYVTDPLLLSKAVEEALNDPACISQMSCAQRQFVSQYFFQLDGCASLRVANAVDALLRRYTKETHSKPVGRVA
jgi:hypothetical protein